MGKATSKYEMSRETEAMFDVYTALTNYPSNQFQVKEKPFIREISAL